MNDKFRFEIVRRGNGRFGWIFVKVDRGRRRVVARSVRDYRSPEKAEDAIDRLRGAPVDDTTVEPDPFPLPATSFRIVSGVVPLIVDDFDDDDASAFSVVTPRAAPVRTAEPKASPQPKKAQAKRRPARKPKPRRRAGRSAA